MILLFQLMPRLSNNALSNGIGTPLNVAASGRNANGLDMESMMQSISINPKTDQVILPASSTSAAIVNNSIQMSIDATAVLTNQNVSFKDVETANTALVTPKVAFFNQHNANIMNKYYQ